MPVRFWSVGGGVAGMHASLTLAEAGVNVFSCGLISHMRWAGHTVGTGHSPLRVVGSVIWPSVSRLTGPMIEVSRHPLITLMTDSRVKSVQGEAGNFTVAVGQKGEYVRRALCDSCGKCEVVCPVEVDVPAHTGMLPHKAIIPAGPPEPYRCFRLGRQRLRQVREMRRGMSPRRYQS